MSHLANADAVVPRVHIVGRKNHGKTTLIVDLIGEFRVRGLRVGTIKHTSHAHQLDTPGKDSCRHGEAGAAVVGILSREGSAAFWPALADGDRYEEFAPLVARCDLVLVEGDLHADAPKIEVYRAEIGGQPLAQNERGIDAVVTDDPLSGVWTTVPRSDVTVVADRVLEYAGIV